MAETIAVRMFPAANPNPVVPEPTTTARLRGRGGLPRIIWKLRRGDRRLGCAATVDVLERPSCDPFFQVFRKKWLGWTQNKRTSALV